MAVWPYAPLLASYEERLRWMPSVLRAYDGTEQRGAYTLAPRQYYQTEHIMSDDRMRTALALLYDGHDQSWQVPAWGEGGFVGSVAAGSGSVNIDTRYSDFRTGVAAAIIWENPEKYETITVASKTDSSLTLTGTVGQTYQTAQIMPLRAAQRAGFPAIAPEKVGMSKISCQWVCTDPLDLSSGTSPWSYTDGTYPVWHDAPLRQYQQSREWKTATLDNGMASSVLDQQESYPGDLVTYRHLLQPASTVWNVRRRLHLLRGSREPFHLPSFRRDIEPSQTLVAGNTSLTITAIDYENRYAQNAGAKWLWMMDTSGVGKIVEVSSSAAGGAGEEVLTLASNPWGADKAASDWAYVCFAPFARIEGSEVVLAWVKRGMAYLSLPCRMVDG